MVQALAIAPDPGAPCLRWSFTNRALIAAQKQTQDARLCPVARGRPQGQKGRDRRLHLRALHETGWGGGGREEADELKGWHTLAVFAAQDTEPLNPDAPCALTYAPREMPPLYGVAERLALSVAYAPHGGAVNGSYSPGKQAIVLHVKTHRTFWHELARAAHHHAAIADFLPGEHDAEAKAYREAVAELTAAVLGELYGEPCVGTSYAYLTRYYPDPLVGITKALGVVGKVLDLITSLVEEPAPVGSNGGAGGIAAEVHHDG